MKQAGERITMLTAYDASFARLLDQAQIDVLLVGDSLGMVVEGQAEGEATAAGRTAAARPLEGAGRSSLNLEPLPADLGAEITRGIAIPTVGIGAGLECDGQVLVVYDLLGMNPEFSPKFVKKYANLAQVIGDAATRYREEVRGGAFPSAEHTFSSEKPSAPPAAVKLYSVAGRAPRVLP